MSLHNGLSGVELHIPWQTGGVDPYGSVTPNRAYEMYLNTTNNSVWYSTSTSNTSWKQVQGALDAPNGPASGDLSANYPGPTVVAVQGHAVSNALPLDGQAMIWDNGNSIWAPSNAIAAASVTNGVYTTDVVGGDLDGNVLSPNVVGIYSRAISNAVPTDGHTLVWDSGNSIWSYSNAISITGTAGFVTNGVYTSDSVGGDLSGNILLPEVIAFRNQLVSNVAPANNYALIWDNSNAIWQAAESNSLAYSPANSSQWVSTAPATVGEAVSRLANLVYFLNSNVAIP